LSESSTDTPIIAGIDVGGTFTDLLLVDQDGVHVVKTPTTVENQAFGVLTALAETGTALSSIGAIVHGTTTTTNAVLERKLSRTGMITTKGFRDIIEVGRRTRPQPYGMFGTFEPIIPRDLRLEVAERMDAAGKVVTPLDEDQVRVAAKRLIQLGCESVVVHFLHAYANPVHEQRTKEILGEVWPNDYITAGHELLSEYREYERGVTASVNAAVRPILHRYINRLQDELTSQGFGRDLLVMNGNGGMVSARLVDKEAAKTVMSGPASGVIAAAHAAKRAGIDNLITYDMGGTSTDVALVMDAVPAVSNELDVEYAMPIHVPMVDVRTIGSGGGSIASVTDAGLLKVGPESAGATPGPVCYGRDGEAPTITDANLILGRLNPQKLLAIEGTPAIDTIRRVFDEKIAAPLGLDVDTSAGAIIRVANDRMAGAIRMVSISKGHDPRDFTLFAFGGAGPLHAVSLAKELGIPRVLVPTRPGITNALGCVVADVRHDFVRTVNRPLDQVDMTNVQGIFTEQINDGRNLIDSETIEINDMRILHGADMQFIGQTHLISIPLPSQDTSREEIQRIFEAAYFDRFQVELPEIRANLVNLKTSVIGLRPEFDLGRILDASLRSASVDEAADGERPVWFDGEWHATTIYARDRLPIGGEFIGPAIVEQMDTTIVIEPGNSVEVDRDGNLLIRIGDIR
jgi:N-methylhydantoinase A